MHCYRSDLLRFEHPVYFLILELKFFFYINAFRGMVNPYFFKMLWEKRGKCCLRSNFLVFKKTEYYLVR